MADPYAEAPLNLREQEIRLVRFERSPTSKPIRCTLQSHVLDDTCPTYIALSYAWGPKERHDDIELNECAFPIGRSLWSFLHRMRAQQQYGTFWIDALSINQRNVLEQNHQVQMMRQIYSGANEVWVWLGEADEILNSDTGMRHLQTRESFGTRDINLNKFWSQTKASAILSLCERQYWKRIWIVQEIMLAKQVTILCGDHRVSWTKLQDLITDLQSIHDRGRAMHTIGVLEVLDSPANVIVNAKAQYEGPQPLAKLLELYRDQQAADIRDKVYALHGLASDSYGIVIDYHIDPKALLIEIIYHTCSANASKAVMKRSKKDTLRFAKIMDEVLKVHCTEEELLFHIAVARGDGVEKNFGTRVRGQKMVPVMSSTPGELPTSTYMSAGDLMATPGYLQLPNTSSASPSLPLPDIQSHLTPKFDHTGQVAPLGKKRHVTTTLWEDEGIRCFQVEVDGVYVARREDNDMINGSKLLNVAGLTHGRRNGVLKNENISQVVKIGPMHLKGVWIPFERALELANKEKITEQLHPLFVHDIGALADAPFEQTKSVDGGI